MSLLAIRGVEPPPAPAARAGRMSALIREGLAWVVGHPMLRAIAGCTGTSNLFGNIVQAVFVLFAIREVGLTPGLLGVVYAGGALGGVLGALVAQRLAGRHGVGPVIVVSALAFSVLELLVPLTPDRVWLAMPLLVAVFAARSLGSTTYNITQVSLRQAITPDGLLGRMNASMRFLVWGTMPVGSFVGGILGQSLGLRPTLWVGAVGGLLAVVWVLASPLAGTRRVDAEAASLTV